MNRRELFQTIAVTVAGAGVADVSLSAVSAEARPALIVLEQANPVSPQMAENLARSLEFAIKDTPFQGLRCVVLSGGTKMTILDASGKALNERIPLEPEPTAGTRTMEAMDEASLRDLVSKPGGIADQVIDAVAQGKRGRQGRLVRALR